MVRSFLMVMSVAAPLVAAEHAVLANGFRMRIERHEMHGDKARLFTNGGTIELPAAQIVRFQSEEAVPAVAPATAAAISPPDTVDPKQVNQRQVDPKQLVTEAARSQGLPPEFVHSVAA